MKVERISDDYINIYINNGLIGDISLDKNTISNTVKKIINKVIKMYRLKLQGFYKVKVYPNKKLGIYLCIIKLDDNEFSMGMDYRVLVYPDSDFYLESEEYLNSYNNIYYNDKFYINIKDVNNIIEIIDKGKIIFGEETSGISSGIKIKNSINEIV